MRTIEEIPLPEPLTIAIQQAGSRKFVLVEGDDDQLAFENSYKKYLSQIYFHSCGGSNMVENHFNQLKNIAQTKRFFGIRDRDFLDDEQVENSYEQNSQFYILKWYCIENYLLDEVLIFKELCVRHKENYREKIGCSSIENIKQYFIELRQSLCAITAAEWLISEFNERKVAQNIENSETERVEYFSTGFDTKKRELIVKQLAQKIGLSENETNTILTQQEILLAMFDTLHIKYNGKRLLHWVCKRFEFKDKEYFKRLLISRLHSEEVNTNFKEIIEDRVLQIQNT